MLNYYVKESQNKANTCIIWMHGLGSSASDMSGLAEQLRLHTLGIRQIFLDAPIRPVTLNNGYHMRAWYDIYDLGFTGREDREGILDSKKSIDEVIKSEVEQGISSNNIFLAGFSQGGAIALYTALHSTTPLGGVIALSSYLPLASEVKPVLNKKTPIFIAYGRFDPVVLPAWTQLTLKHLNDLGYSAIEARDYPMDHTVCASEVNDMEKWLSSNLQGEHA